MNLSIWVAGDIKTWFFTPDKWINTLIVDLPTLKFVGPCQNLSVMPHLSNVFWEVCLTMFSLFPFRVQIASRL